MNGRGILLLFHIPASSLSIWLRDKFFWKSLLNYQQNLLIPYVKLENRNLSIRFFVIQFFTFGICFQFYPHLDKHARTDICWKTYLDLLPFEIQGCLQYTGRQKSHNFPANNIRLFWVTFFLHNQLWKWFWKASLCNHIQCILTSIPCPGCTTLFIPPTQYNVCL